MNKEKIINCLFGDWFPITIAFVIFMSIVLFGFLNFGNSDNLKKPRSKQKSMSTKTSDTSKKITYNIIVKGNGNITFQDIKYKVEGLKDFEVLVSKHTDIILSWKSLDENKLSIYIKGDGLDNLEKEWESKKGEISFKSGDASCFIVVNRPEWIFNNKLFIF